MKEQVISREEQNKAFHSSLRRKDIGLIPKRNRLKNIQQKYARTIWPQSKETYWPQSNGTYKKALHGPIGKELENLNKNNNEQTNR